LCGRAAVVSVIVAAEVCVVIITVGVILDVTVRLGREHIELVELWRLTVLRIRIR
jgi:hypothetical protein